MAEAQQRADRSGPDARARTQRFQARLENGVQTVLAYEDPIAQACALSVIPLERLETEAEALVASSASASAAAASPAAISRPDARLLRLLRWFKHEFFTWCNTPSCPSCGCEETRNEGMTAPSDEERAFGASRVESYRCPRCSAAVRFPRYNDAKKLLETRVGRCGEWANAFTLCCRALGYEARWVMDWTDHVWTEVWSESQARWLHCDSCEDACDKPLLYEKGWGKKLSYVIGFGKDGVVDVTRRYTADFADTATRRGECDEGWLASATRGLTSRLRMGEGDARRRRRLEERDAEEQRELQIAGCASQGGDREEFQQVLPGRQTGSLAWRAARGELGANTAAVEAASSADPWSAASVPAAVASPVMNVQIPVAKALSEELVVAATHRVSSSSNPEQLDVFKRLLGNILKDPTNAKFRRLKMSNPKVAGAVGGGTFGKELLVALGFVAKNDAKDGLVFVLGPGGADVSAVLPAMSRALETLGTGSDTAASMSAVTEATGNLNIASSSFEPSENGSTADERAKEVLQKAVHAEFTRLVHEEGITANEAAIMAIKNVKAKMMPTSPVVV